MPDSDFFRRLGLFVIDGFLDSAECARLRSEIDAAPSVAALVARGGQDHLVDEDFRRAKVADVSKSTASLMRSRFRDLQSQLAQHFRLPLADCEHPQFLAYDPGCFFRAHNDSNSHPDAADYLKSRLVSLVLFLNAESRPGSGTGNLPVTRHGQDPDGSGQVPHGRGGATGVPPVKGHGRDAHGTSGQVAGGRVTGILPVKGHGQDAHGTSGQVGHVTSEPAEGCYGGGRLTLYGLLDGANWENCPLPVRAETGLLVAFRSDLTHEVKPVTFGRRYTIVTWFHSPPNAAA